LPVNDRHSGKKLVSIRERACLLQNQKKKQGGDVGKIFSLSSEAGKTDKKLEKPIDQHNHGRIKKEEGVVLIGAPISP